MLEVLVAATATTGETPLTVAIQVDDNGGGGPNYPNM